jgi:hypothetical protein
MERATVMRGEKFSNEHDAVRFILGGNAVFTLVSEKTGARYTYRVRLSDDGKCWFVSVLTGSNNESDYTYIGLVRGNNRSGKPVVEFTLTKASKMTSDSLPVRGFRYTLDALVAHTMPNNVAIWHEGRCGRCGRTLTVPESLASGLGPECAKRMVA